MKDKLKAGLPFGCLFVFLLGGALTLLILMANTLGNCSDCGVDRGSRIVEDFGLALPIVLGGTIVAWLVASLLRGLLQVRLPPIAANMLLSGLTIAAAWLAFWPAADLLIWMGR